MTETYHHGNLRKDLISAGIKMLSRDGIGSFSLRRLSRELGVSHAAAYRHFSSREELLRAILIETSTMFRDALTASVKPGVSGQEALYQLGAGYVRFYLAHPEILPLFFTIPVKDDDMLMSLLSGLDGDDPLIRELGIHFDFPEMDSISKSSSFGIFRQIASAAGELEPYRHLSEKEILLGFWSKVHGMAALLVTQKNFIPPEELDEVIEKVIRTPF